MCEFLPEIWRLENEAQGGCCQSQWPWRGMITDFRIWSECYAPMDILSTQYPDKASHLFAYLQTIYRASCTFESSAWASRHIIDRQPTMVLLGRAPTVTLETPSLCQLVVHDIILETPSLLCQLANSSGWGTSGPRGQLVLRLQFTLSCAITASGSRNQAAFVCCCSWSLIIVSQLLYLNRKCTHSFAKF